MGVLFSNNAATTLSAGISDSVLTIPVVDASDFPAVGGSDYAYLTLAVGSTVEIVKCTAIAGNSLTVVRAQDGTSASAFSLGDKCELRVATAALTDALAERQPLATVLTNTTASYTAAEESKLAAIEASATADQSNAEIAAAVEAATDSNTFTDGDHTKLNGIEAAADVTDGTNVTAAGALMDSELTAIASVKALDQGVAQADSPTWAGVTLTSDLTFSGVDPEIQGGDTDGVLITSPNTNALGAVIKQYGDTHATKAGDFEFYDDVTLVANYDASAAKWYFKGIDYSLFDISAHYGDELDAGLTPIILIHNAGFAFDIIDMSYVLSVGAITVNLQIAGVSVTSLNALSVTTTEQTTTATGANSVAAGADLQMTITGMTTADRNFSFTIHCQRT